MTSIVLLALLPSPAAAGGRYELSIPIPGTGVVSSIMGYVAKLALSIFNIVPGYERDRLQEQVKTFLKEKCSL